MIDFPVDFFSKVVTKASKYHACIATVFKTENYSFVNKNKFSTLPTF